MPILVVVNDPKEWPLAIEGIELVPAKAYLTDPAYAKLSRTKIFNLCRSYRYQAIGYYVSLLAEARGHKPMPDISTIQDIKSQTIIRLASADLDELIQKSLGPIKSEEFVLSIYFGHNLAKRHDELSQKLYKTFPAPFLRANFQRHPKTEHWQMVNINAIAASEIPDEHRDFVVEVARDYFLGKRRFVKRRSTQRYDLAILHNPEETEAPSNERALKRFIKAAESLDLATELITREDYGRLAEFDALFIRETTSVNHHTYRFARLAHTEGLVVVDDPESILKCTNKVFLAELLERKKVPIPRSLIVHKENVNRIVPELGLPCILKKPDSSFSQGVHKMESEEDLHKQVAAMLEKSDLIIAQEFLPTTFDWRIGVFDRQPLYACKYYMAKAHWQIIKRDEEGHIMDDGRFETIPVEHVPNGALQVALKAANLIGESLYGVDVKQVENKFYVIEVNDNPNIDAGIEDAVLKEELYLRIMRVFLRRIESRYMGYDR
ncbi:MAG: RimK family protein [Deltaproteobacteria bacterium]